MRANRNAEPGKNELLDALLFSEAGMATYGASFDEAEETSDAFIREQVLEFHRDDMLAEFVLGYTPQPFHLEMMQWQEMVQEGLLLAWRGSGKTTYCTLTRCIGEVLRDPNIRILLVSDALDQAKVFMRSIKQHFEKNAILRRIFGDYAIGARQWTDTEITVNRRRSFAGEPTIMCAGLGTALPSRHFDLIIADDLVTEDNAITDGQRRKTHDYFYKTLLGTLEQPHGRLYVIGTRWHDDDLYGWLQREDYSETHMVMGVLDEETDLSRWEAKFKTERLHRIRKANLAAFELQYMCRSGIGIGGIFNSEHFVTYVSLPDLSEMWLWQGVDLAIGQKAHNDFFSHATVGIHRETKFPYLVDYLMKRLPFPKQVTLVDKRYHLYPSTVRVVAENNAYQDALRQQVRDNYPDVPIVGRYTSKDKVTRAQKLALGFTDKPLHVARHHSNAVRLLCGFPNVKGSKDLFDSIDLAIAQGLQGARKRRSEDEEPGLI